MMKAQTLETIPEETVEPATPNNITSDVPKTKPATAKNPGRHEDSWAITTSTRPILQ